MSGQVIGTDTGRVRVEILAGADQTMIHSQQGTVDDGSYRLTLVDLSNNLTPKFSNQNQIRALLLGPDDNPIASMEIRDLTTSEISSGLVSQNFVANQPPIIKAEAQTSILMLSDQYLINLDDYFIDLDVKDFLSFKIERIQLPSFLALYDGPESNEVLQEEDQLVTNQLEVFMADLGQAEFEITAIDTKGDFVSTTIQVTREQLITVVDEIDFGTVLPGMSVERKLLIQNTASAEELYITNINSNLGPLLFITERPTPSNPLVLSAGQEAELTVTVLLDDSSSEFNVPRLIISSNEPDGGTTIIPINLEVGQLSIPTETNLMVVEGYVEKTSAQVYENLSVGVWVERGIEVDTDDDGLEDSWEEYHFNNDLTFTDGSQDSDGDDQDNWAEFHGRSDPNDASFLPRYFEDVPVNNDGSYRMLLANLPTGSEPVSPVVAEGDTIFVYLDDQADKGSDEESYQITTTDIRDNFIQIDLEAVMTISKSIPIKGFDDPVVLTITDQIVGLKQPPRIQQVRTAEQERMVTKLQIGIQQGQPARQIETVLKIEVPGTTNTGIGGIFHETPLGIEIPFDTNKAEPVDVIALISIDSVNRSETVEILETEIIGNKLKAQLAHLSYVVTMKNTAPVFHASQANQSLEAIGATEDIQMNSRMLATNAGGDSQLLNLNGMFSDSDSEIGDQMTYEATSDNPELLNVAVVEGEVMQLMLETTDDKSQEGIAEISILVEDTNGSTSEALIFYVDVASILPDHWQDEIDLQLGLNLFSLPLQPINQIGELEQWTAADLADKISATVIVSMDNGQFVPFIPQVMKNNDGSYLDQGFDLEGGKAYIINVLDDLTLTLDGQPWSNSPNSEGIDQPLRNTETNFDDSLVRRAPNRILAPWTFVVSGNLATDPALSFGFDLSQVARVLAVNTETGQESICQIEGSRFHFVMSDLTMRPVVAEGQAFEIRAEDANGNLIAGPISWQLDTNHLRQAYIHKQLTVGDVIPDQTRLLPNYPNPFNPETWIPFELQRASDVQLAIFDSKGNIIRQLDLGHQIAGRYLSKNRAAYWDGNNQLGEQVSSGVYFYTFIAESEQSKWLPQTRKMVILK
ncbi:hypothetical protein CMK18_16070 [Candidatus Poribacteria bacterium]|nr:hypothetical protein [Candidatus Poribacteria bacterium]